MNTRFRHHHLSWPIFFVLTITLGAMATAHADTKVRVRYGLTQFPDLDMFSTGAQYTNLTAVNYFWEGDIKIETTADLRVKNWNATPHLKVNDEGGNDIEAAVSSVNQNYGIGNRPGTVDKTIGTQFPDADIKEFARRACSLNAELLRQKGFDDAYIFGRDHKIAFRAELSFDEEITGGQYFEWLNLAKNSSPPLLRTLTCRKQSGPQVPAGSNEMAIENSLETVEFHIRENANKSGHCSVDLYGRFETKQVGSRIDYHFVHQETGRRSPRYSLITNAAKQGGFSHNFDVPNNENNDGTGSIALYVTNYKNPPTVMNFAMTCTPPGATDLATKLPPIMSLDVEPEDNTMIDGQICPTRVRLVAGIEARSDLEGQIIFVGTGYFSKPQPMQLANGRNKQYGDYRDLTWKTSGGFGSALQSTSSGPKPLRTQSFLMGYNLLNKDGEIAYQFNNKSFQVTCRRPQTNPVIADDSPKLGTAIHVQEAILRTQPVSALTGASCGVKLEGTLRANATNATIRLDVRNQLGQTLGRHTVTTDSQKLARFSDYIDFNKPAQGDLGSMTANVNDDAEQSGYFKIVGTSVKFESNVAAYRVTCHEKSPGGLVTPVKPKPAIPMVGGLTMKPRKPVDKTATAPIVAKQFAPRDDPDSKPNSKIANAIVAKPRREPAKEVGKIALSAPDIALKRIDAAVTGAKMNIRGRVGSVNAKIANMGDTDLRGTVVIQIRNGRGRTVTTIREPLRLAAGDSRIINKRFRVGKAKRFIANIAVHTPNDANPRNNEKKVSTSR